MLVISRTTYVIFSYPDGGAPGYGDIRRMPPPDEMQLSHLQRQVKFTVVLLLTTQGLCHRKNDAPEKKARHKVKPVFSRELLIASPADFSQSQQRQQIRSLSDPIISLLPPLDSAAWREIPEMTKPKLRTHRRHSLEKERSRAFEKPALTWEDCTPPSGGQG